MDNVQAGKASKFSRIFQKKDQLIVPEGSDVVSDTSQEEQMENTSVDEIETHAVNLETSPESKEVPQSLSQSHDGTQEVLQREVLKPVPSQVAEEIDQEPTSNELDPNDPCVSADLEVEVAQRLVTERSDAFARLQNQQRLLDRNQTRTSHALHEREVELEAINEALNALKEWVHPRQESFAWKLAGELSSERSKAGEEKDSARSRLADLRAKRPRLPGTNFSVRRFFIVISSLLVLLALAVFALQLLKSYGASVNPGAPWAWARDLPAAWPMSGYFLLVYMTFLLLAWFSYERDSAYRILRDRSEDKEMSGASVDLGIHGALLIDFAKRVITAIPVGVLIVLGLRWLKSVTPEEFSQYIPEAWKLILTGVAVFIVLCLVATFRYYKGLSQLRHRLRKLVYDAQQLRAIYNHAYREERRLETVHGLIPDFLEALSRGVHEPWEIDTSAINMSELHPDVSRLPASVALADATTGIPEQHNQLRSRALSVLVAPGWIGDSLNEVISSIISVDGLPGDRLSLEAIASDPGDSRRGPRRRLVEGSQRKEVLRHVGRRRLKQTSLDVQKSVIRKVRPHVQPLRDNELENLDIASTRFRDEYGRMVDWSVFLNEALGEAAPFSLLAFSDEGIAQRSHAIFQSTALVPNDLETGSKDSRVKVISEFEAGGLPLDLVVRIDQSNWLTPNLIRLFDGVEGIPQEEEPTRVRPKGPQV